MSNAPGPGDRDATSADQSADEQLPPTGIQNVS